MASGLGFPARALAASAAAALYACASPLLAQEASRAVVQPLPPPEARQLSEALQRLAADPRDLDALIAAGNASLKLDDVDAALGFFARAEDIAPGDPRSKAGMAAAMVQEENPFEALRLFDEAERAGASLVPLAIERALAYDLVGDNARAQQLYREVLARGEDPEASRRLAISLAISGDQAGMERVLLPMLQRRDLAAYRARAFALAILGKVDEAQTISDAVMPKSMAARIAPYLRYMPRLTRAQQAAAANLGNFPRTAEIGRDDPRIAQLGAAGVAPAAPQPQAVDARLVPSGEPLGPSPDDGRRRPDREDAEQVTLAAAAPPPIEPDPEPEPAVAQPPLETLAEATVPEPVPAGAAPIAASAAEVAATEPVPEPVSEPARTEVALAEIPGPKLSLGEPEPGVVAVAEPLREPAAEPAFDLAQIAGSREAPAPDVPGVAEVALAGPPPAVFEPAPAAVAPAPGLETESAVLDAASPAFGSPAPIVEPVIVDTVEAVAIAAPAPTLAPADAPPMQVLNGPAGATVATAVSAPSPAPAQANVASAFADFEFSLAATTPAAGAVDLSRISAPREQRVEPKPAAPRQPARHWVQLATARDRTRLGFDFGRISDGSKGLLKGARGYLAQWGETNRLLTGPFATEAAAQAFVTRLDEAGVKAFTFTSEDGEEVTALAAR